MVAPEWMKTISVVVPMYNSAGTILAALDSIRSQTWVDAICEIIVINDGSTDGCGALVEEYCACHPAPQIIIIKQRNKGVSAARNVGMKQARGRYIAFLDSDDIWLPEKTEKQLKVLTDHPEICLLGAGCSDKPLRIGIKRIDKLYKATAKDVCIKSFPVTPSVIIKREVCDSVGYFDENQRFAEDINYFQRIGSVFNYYYLPENLVSIGQGKSYFGESGLTSNMKAMQMGALKNLEDLRYRGDISVPFYYAMQVFYRVKYVRRIALRKLNQLQGVLAKSASR